MSDSITIDSKTGIPYVSRWPWTNPDYLAGFVDYKYVRYHIPTGQRTVDVVYCHNHHNFLELLNSWNESGGEFWKYWGTV